VLNNLQILRAFAALNVVLFHIIIIGEAQGFGIPSLEFLSGWGANGVAVLLAGDFQGQPVTGELIAGSFLFFTRWADIYQPIIYVGWTLEWEMLFYLIFGLCLIFKDRAVQFALPLVILTALTPSHHMGSAQRPASIGSRKCAAMEISSRQAFG